MANKDKIITQGFMLIFGVLALQICFKSLSTFVLTSVWALVVLLLLLCSLLLLEFYRRLVPGIEYPLKESLLIFIGNLAIDLVGGFQYWRLTQQTKRCQEVQDEFLLQLLEKRKNTEYGIKHGFSKIKSRDEFCKKIPSTKHLDIKKYMEKILDGENNILFPQRANNINCTSGTSGEGVKHFAKSGENNGFLLKNIPISRYLTHRAYSEVGLVTKRFRMPSITRWKNVGFTTKGGYTIGVVSENHSKNKARQLVEISYTSPSFVQGIDDEYSLAYVFLLLALRDRYATCISGNISVVVYITLSYMEKDWPSLVRDIRTGSLRTDLDVPKEIRKQLEAMIIPDGQRADELEIEFKKGFVGICKRVWPRMCMVETVTSGSLGYYRKLLSEGLCNGLPIYSSMFGCTEGFSAVNLWQEKPVSYLPLIADAFVEFIPEENRFDENPPTLTMEETEITKCYEVLVTNADGLYRYRIGDIFKICDKFNQTPLLEYQYRSGDYLDIFSERLSSDWVDRSIDEALKSFQHLTLVYVTYAVSVKVDEVKRSMGMPVTGRGLAYTVFIELLNTQTRQSIGSEDQEKITEMVEKNLRQFNFIYDKARVEEKMDALEVNFLRKRAFVDLVSHLQEQGACSDQVKIPKVLKRPGDIRCLLEQRFA